MLLADNADLADAIKADTRRYRIVVEADWDGDGLYGHTHSDLSAAVESATLSRDAAGDLPDEVWLVEGHSVGSLRVRLRGRVAGTPVVTLLSSWQPSSPLADHDLVGTRVRCTVVVTTAAGPVTVPQFTGVIRSVAPDSRARTVDLEILDLAAVMYAQIGLPFYATLLPERYGSSMDLHVVTQWVVDHVLRANGIYASPSPVAGAILSATGHGSLAAEIGYNGTPVALYANTTAVWNTAGKWAGMLATPASWGTGSLVLQKIGQYFYPTAGVAMSNPGVGVAVSSWIYVGGTMTGVTPAGTRIVHQLQLWQDPNELIFVTIREDGLITAYYSAPGFTSATVTRALSGAESWRYLGVHVGREAADVMRLTLRIDGTSNSVTFTRASGEARHWAMLFTGCHRSWSNLQMWPAATAPAGTWPGESSTWTSQADVAVGAAHMTYLPEVVAGKGLQVLKDAVGAEFGTFGFDEEGRFSFTAADWAAPDPGATDLTVTADRPLSDLGTVRRLDAVRNRVTVTVEESYLDPGKIELIVDARDVAQFRTLPGWAIHEVDLPFMLSGGAGFQSIPFVASASWGTATTRGFCVVRVDDPATVPSGVSVWFEQMTSRRGRIVVNNASGTTVQFATTSANGSAPALRMEGYKLQAQPDHVYSQTIQDSVDRFGPRVLPIGRDPWRSLRSSYATLAGSLVSALRDPIAVLEDVPLAGDPRVQIGDVHRIEDPTGIGPVLTGTVQGIRRTFDRGGMKANHTYKVVPPDLPATSWRLWPATNGAGSVNFGAIVVATEFYVTQDCWATKLHYYRTDTNINGSAGRIWRVDSSSSGVARAGTDVTFTASGTGWQTANLAAPVLLAAGQHYRVAVLFSGTPANIPITSSYWKAGVNQGGSDGIIQGPLVAPNAFSAIGGQGSFQASSVMTYPATTNSSNDGYWIDATIIDQI